LCSLAGPLLLSFDKKVAFYKKWKFLFPSMLLPALFYIIWDIWFTEIGIWSFNEKYITGIKLYNLPIEEVLFFFIVPYCSVFIYECIHCYFPNLKQNSLFEKIFQTTGILLFIAAMIFCSRYYTFITFSLNSIFILLFFMFRRFIAEVNITTFIISYLITLIPFLIVNGFLTALPVVEYNDNQNMGFRIYTIPFEDIFYGMLLIFLNVCGFEYRRNKLR
jgi:lycopene cyclase domain-containing protein